ncbi:zinc knuckle CX2CX4HX4C containing protein [Tanacetum coccineum]
MERGFLASNKKDKKNEGGSKASDDLKAGCENDLAAKIKNIEGKVIGMKPIHGNQLFDVMGNSAHDTTTTGIGKKQEVVGNPMLKSILKRLNGAANVSGVKLVDFAIVDSNMEGGDASQISQPSFVKENDDIVDNISTNNDQAHSIHASNHLDAATFDSIQGVDSFSRNVDGRVAETFDDDATKQDTGVKPVSYASMLQAQPKTIVKIKELHSEEVVEGATVAILYPAIEEVRCKFGNILYVYFIGKHVAFLLVEKYVKNTWAKFGLERLMLRKGFFFFQFSSREGMEKVLKHGPWLICLVPLILNIWSPTSTLKKDETTLAPVWVKLHNVPIVAYSETRLSLITTKIGHPIMLDAYTCDMCVNPWGKNTYARALIEVLTANALLDSLVVAIPLPNGKGHTLETIEIEYEWRPPRYDNCKIFDHTDTRCPKKVDVIKLVGNNKPSTMPSTSGDNEDGFVEVKTRKKKGKKDEGTRAFGGIRMSKPKSIGEKSTPTSNVFDVLTSVEVDDQGDLNQTRDSQIPKPSNEVAENESSKGGNEETQSKDHGSLWEKFKASKEASSSKATSTSSDPISSNADYDFGNPESDEDEVFDPDDTSYMSSFGGGNQLEDDFSREYKPQVYDLPMQLDTFVINLTSV